MRASDGAYATSTRPHGAAGKLFACETVCQVRPASLDRNIPLALGAVGFSPPDRNVQPLRRKSHMPASITSGFLGSSARLEHPGERFAPGSTSDHDFPPSVVLYTPRSLLSLHSLPGTHAYTVLLSRGLTMIRTIRSDSRRPMFVQVSPPSVER